MNILRSLFSWWPFRFTNKTSRHGVIKVVSEEESNDIKETKITPDLNQNKKKPDTFKETELNPIEALEKTKKSNEMDQEKNNARLGNLLIKNNDTTPDQFVQTSTTPDKIHPSTSFPAIIQIKKKLASFQSVVEGTDYKIDPNCFIELVMPNLMVGQSYDLFIPLIAKFNYTNKNFQKFQSENNSELGGINEFFMVDSGGFNDFQKTGLTFLLDEKTKSIQVSGKPTISGDFKGTFLFGNLFKIGTPICPILFKGSAKLSINPDPKSLWKELDPPDGELFPKPHLESAKINNTEGVLVAASRRGRSHAHNGTFRDDNFSLTYLEEFGLWIIAVADGAGSSKLSRQGSFLACQNSVTFIKNSLTSMGKDKFKSTIESGICDPSKKIIGTLLYNLLAGAAMNSNQLIVAEAAKINKPTKDFSTTLNLTLIKLIDNRWLVGTYAVGDGGVVAINTNGEIFPLSEYDEGEFAGQTRFLNSPEVWKNTEEVAKRIKFIVLTDLKYVFASTDGITDPYFPTMRDFENPKNWQDFISALETTVGLSKESLTLEQNLLDWLNFWSVGNHDDRTIAFFSV